MSDVATYLTFQGSTLTPAQVQARLGACDATSVLGVAGALATTEAARLQSETDARNYKTLGCPRVLTVV